MSGRHGWIPRPGAAAAPRPHTQPPLGSRLKQAPACGSCCPPCRQPARTPCKKPAGSLEQQEELVGGLLGPLGTLPDDDGMKANPEVLRYSVADDHGATCSVGKKANGVVSLAAACCCRPSSTAAAAIAAVVPAPAPACTGESNPRIDPRPAPVRQTSFGIWCLVCRPVPDQSPADIFS